MVISVFLDFRIYEYLTFFEYEGTLAHLRGASETQSVGPPVRTYETIRERRSDYRKFCIMKFDRNLSTPFKLE